jgi:hypothetical protein
MSTQCPGHVACTVTTSDGVEAPGEVEAGAVGDGAIEETAGEGPGWTPGLVAVPQAALAPAEISVATTRARLIARRFLRSRHVWRQV